MERHASPDHHRREPRDTAATIRPPSGTQLRIAADGYSATIATVGASVREFRHGERDLFVPFAESDIAPRFNGAILAPWPNRITDGRWDWNGVAHQLPITEVARRHALHGLVVWTDFGVVVHTADVVELATVIPAQPGYPFSVALRIEYRLGRDGLTTTVTATNRSVEEAPFGVGAHPWIAVPGGLADATLVLPAGRVLRVEGERMIPAGVVDVPPVFDFRTGRPLGATSVDHAFTGLAGGPAGTAPVDIVGADGTGVRLTPGAGLPWVQVCTFDWVGPDQRRAIAIEPMSCSPDAFRTGDGATVIAPSRSATWHWRYGAIGGDGQPSGRPTMPRP